MSIEVKKMKFPGGARLAILVLAAGTAVGIARNRTPDAVAEATVPVPILRVPNPAPELIPSPPWMASDPVQVGWGEGPVDPAATVYDLASLTKVVATTTAVMLLAEDGRLELDAPVGRYLPEFRGGAKQRVTIRHLLTHTSGLPAGSGAGGKTPRAALARLIATPLRGTPGGRVVYSDVGFVVLWAAAERAAGEPLPELLEQRVWSPLGMRSTGFRSAEGCDLCAPTGGGRSFRGRVHDPIARRLGGVAGNAGLFSTARDLARFAAMMANGGELDGVRVLRAETIHRFTTRQTGAGRRALGWDTSRGTGAFGHTGFTGTSIWIDSDRGTWTVLLCNRTYRPRAPNRIGKLRRVVHDWVARAADPSTIGA